MAHNNIVVYHPRVGTWVDVETYVGPHMYLGHTRLR